MACAIVRLLRTPTRRSRFGVNDASEVIDRPGTCWSRLEAARLPRIPPPEPSLGVTSVAVDSYTFGIHFDVAKARTLESAHRARSGHRRRQTISARSATVRS